MTEATDSTIKYCIVLCTVHGRRVYV